MSDKIKPSEVSQVLLDQLKGISDAEKFDEVGTVLTVSDLNFAIVWTNIK